MVAVVSGSGLGLFNNSGAAGNSNVGRGRDQVFVNTTTGNLVVQGVDDALLALGLDFAAIRTYNSQGFTDEDNNDQWRLGVHQKVVLTSGTVNQANSVVTKTFGDGSEIKYNWNATRSRYESTDGDGANDFLTWNSGNSTWTWTDGSSRATEEYGLVSSVQRIKFSRDADGNTVTYNYTGSLLTSLNMANPGGVANNAQTVTFTYNGNNLASISVASWDLQLSQMRTQTLTRYYYDTSNRLKQVVLDLTPADNTVTLPDANSDSYYEAVANQTYVTTYTYDGTSKRIASIAQNDGSSVSFTYQNLNGDHRLKTVTDAEGRVTTFTYSDVTGGGGTAQSAPVNTSVASHQETTSYPRDDLALTSNATQTTPYARNDAALSTTKTTETTTQYGITGTLTQPTGGAWGTASTLEAQPSGSTASVPQVAFDGNGNGFAIWTVQQSSPSTSYTLKAARYTRSTNTWDSPVALYSATSGSLPQASLAVGADGKAVVAWMVGGAISAARYTGSSWAATETLVSSGATLKPAASISGNFAAVIWGEGSGSGLSAYVSRWTGSAWTAKASVDTQSNPVSELGVAVDSLGNVLATFTQIEGAASVPCVWTNQYRVSTGAWTGAVSRDPLSPAAGSPQVALDANGNGFMTFAQSNETYIMRYTRSSNTWTTPAVIDSLSGSVSQTALSLDAAGNAVIGWIQTSGGAASVYAAIYNAATSTMGAPVSLESLTTAATSGSLRVSINGTFATAVWIQNDGTRDNAYAATFNGSTWSAATTIESSTSAPSAPTVAIDSLGNASVLWIQSNGTAPSLYSNRFAAGGGSPYYTVPSGATWQSIANAVYGQNTTAAGEALRLALGNPTLSTGLQLSGFPNPLSVTTSTVITVPAYYKVPAGATWQSIANAVYGINIPEAGTALQTQLGNPTLATDVELTGFPASLSVTVTLAPHYLVPSGASWQSIAAALYGPGANTAAAGSALQTALGNPSIAAGARLYNIPASLQVTQTVPYYVYVVQAADTWSSITQALYGTTDANAIAQLQAAVGTSTLQAGANLHVPDTLNYTAGATGAGVMYQRTDVQDGLSLTWTYLKDSAGRLIAEQTPSLAGGGRLEKRYTYDAVTGNVATITEDPNGLNRVTAFSYDAATGLLLNQRDHAGNTLAYTYNSNNQLATETRYTVRDPDGAGSGQPSGALITRYLYDSENHLRFVVSPDGRVTEHIYDTGPGLRLTTFVYASSTYTGSYDESSLNSWATNPARRGGPLERTDYAYDFRGNISTITRYAATNSSGAGSGASWVTRFVYDQRGMLLSTIEPRGEATSTPTNDYVTSYTYDGLGRRLTATSWVSGSETARLIEAVTYNDAGRSTVTNFANGLIKTLTYNRVNELIGVSDNASPSAPTSYTYDANGRLRVITDPTLLKTYSFYDAAGRLQGTVDGTGSLVEFIYNGANQLVKTVRYAKAIAASSMTALAGGSWATVLFSDLRTEANTSPAANRITRNVYDAAGVQVFAIDEIGAVTKFVRDGAGRLTDTVQYRNTVSIAASTGEVLQSAVNPAVHADDRTTRHFYNGDGLLIGTLDGAGFLTERIYDAAGRLSKEIGYFNAVDVGRRGNATIDTMRPGSAGSTAQLDAVNDVTTRCFYDAQGRKIGSLDGERYLTEYVYDVTNFVLQEIRYDRALTSTSIDADFATFKAAAATAVKHITANTFNGLGQLVSSVNFENTPTTFTYDSGGNLTSTTVGTGGDARTTAARYDLLGRVTQELTAEGYAFIAGLSSPTQTQINDAWNKYGVTYGYDAAGRRVSATVRPNDTQTNTTYFYYDNDGRLRFELDPRGRVTEYRYNDLGQLKDKLVSWRTVTVSSPAGGLLTPALITTLTGYESFNTHEKTTLDYDLRGAITSTLTAAGATTASTYNTFGELETSTAGAGFTALTYTFDQRGLVDKVYRASLMVEDRDYDAFGRLVKVTDARGNSTTFTHDRLGREIASKQTGDTNATQITYDGFSRVLTSRDKLLNTTQFVYNDTARTVTVTTPENVEIVTTHNVHGEDTTVVVRAVGAAAGTYNTTTYQYDKNGRLTSVSDNLGALESRAYDRAGRHTSATDARGVVTNFNYDASDRILTRTVDPAGLNLSTSFAFDTQNRVMTVTEPGNRVTRTEYDRDGRVAAVTVDFGGATPSRTEYQYDTANNTTLVTEGAGSAKPRRTLYVYNALGQRSEEIVDPTSLGGTLNLRTQYRYDNAGNLARKIDAELNSTWYVYDAQNRLTQTIDALGGVTAHAYDDQDRRVSTRRHAASVTVGAFGDVVAQQTIATSVDDRVSYSVFDRDGNERFTIAVLGVVGGTERGVVTERTFDANGNVASTRVIGQDIAIPSSKSVAGISALLTRNNAVDRFESTFYDLRGRAIYDVNAERAVTKISYDAAGNVVERIEYAALAGAANVDTLAHLDAWSGSASIINNADNRMTRYWYDTRGRVRYVRDAAGYLTQTIYDDLNRTEETRVYAQTVPVLATTSSFTSINSAVTLTPAEDRTTVTSFDVAGRVVKVERQWFNGSATQSIFEEFTYDAVGNKKTYRNAAASVWSYEYDANGRLLDERSPQVSITRVTDTAGVLAESTSDAQIITRMTYDKLGNVRTRTEGIRLAGGVEDASDSRVTSYQYDALGRQIHIDHPAIRTYNAAGDSVTSVAAASSRPENALTETTVDVTYNALGDMVVNRDVGGGTSRKAYDNLGRLRYEVDALNYVTEYRYDSFGNRTQTIRYSKTVNLGLVPASGVWTLGQIAGAVRTTAGEDRVLTQEYDQLNRVSKVIEPPVFVYVTTEGSANAQWQDNVSAWTSYQYNAFGELSVETRLIDPINNTTAETLHYYDGNGRETFIIDPERYVTEQRFDASGSVARRIEYARAIPVGSALLPASRVATTPANLPDNPNGYDRDVKFTYDQLGRLREQLVYNVEFTTVTVAGGVASTTVKRDGVQKTTYGYDAVGNRTRISEFNGDAPYTSTPTYETFTKYDALGRVVKVAQPARAADVDGESSEATSSVMPLEENRYDVFGNLVQTRSFLRGAASASESDIVLPTNPPASEVRSTYLLRDAQGNVRVSQDASGARREYAYTARGEVAKEWQTITDAAGRQETLVKYHGYDLLGREVTLITPQMRSDSVRETFNNASPIYTQISYTQTRYNAFGEVYQRGVNASLQADGTALAEYMDYDLAGRLWRTNVDDGIDKVLFYDAAGRNTAELRSQDLGVLKAQPSASAALAVVGRTLRTDIVYDKLDHVTEKRLPSFTPSDGLDPATTAINITPVGSSARITWARNDATVVALFEYRLAGSAGAYSTRNVDTINSGTQYGVTVDGLWNNLYEYQITYSRTTEITPFARTSGTFRVDTSTGVSILSITQNAPVTTDQIANVGIGTMGPLTATVTFNSSAGQIFPPGGNSYWVGPNVVNVTMPALPPGRYWVRVDYQTLAGSPSWFYDEWLDPSTSEVAMSATDGGGGGMRTTPLRVRVWNLTNSEIGELVRDSAQVPGPPGLIWQAPASSSVTAVFRYKRSTESTWSSGIAVSRFGDNFGLDISQLLTATSVYDFEIEHLNNGVLFAKKSGQISSTGLVTLRDVTGALNDAAFSSYTPTISPPDVQGTDIVWQAATGVPAGSTMSATFEYRTSGGSYVPLALTPPGSGWRASVGGLTAGTNYQYRISFKQDGRIVSQQEGTFLLTFFPATTSTAVTVSQGSQQVVAPVATINGSSGVGSINYTGAASSVWTSTPQGSFWAGPNRVFVTTAALPAGSYEMRVEYMNGSNQPRTGIGAYPPPAAHPNEFHWDGSQGLTSVTSVRIYKINADGTRALIRDRSVSGSGAPQSLSWAAPSNVTARFWYYDNGWIEKTPTTSGGNLTVDLSGLTNKDYNYQVAYYRPGEPNSPMVEATGTFRSDGVSISMVGSQTTINRNPTWFSTSTLGSRVQWTQAVPTGFTAVFEYFNGTSWVPRTVSSTGGSSYYADLAGVAQGNYQFRVEYRRSGDLFPSAWSSGTVQVQVTPVSNYTTLAATRVSDTLIPTARITNPVRSGDTVSWSYAKLNATDSVVFRYTVNGTTYSESLSGTGPNFSASMSQLPAGSSVAVSWAIEYKRSGEGSPYAAAYGSTTFSVVVSQQQPIFGVLSQQHAYPTVIPLAAPTHVGGGHMRWSDTPEAGAIVEFKYGSTNAPISADRMQADLSAVADGTYTYVLTFRRSGQPTPYARVEGSFTLSRTAALGAMTITISGASGSAAVRPTTKQVSDRWGNVISITDPSLYTTVYRYNVLGQLVETKLPTLTILDTRAAPTLVNINTSVATPTEKRYYDILGRVVGARDANGNLTAVALNSAGQVVDEYQPNGRRSFQYDAFGNQTLIIDELNWRTINKYDAMDRLTATKNQITGSNGVGTYISREFTYDKAGRRITETSGEKKADNSPEITSYFYDLEDHVVRRKTPMDAQTWIEYDVNGNRKREVDAMGRELTWSYDFAGRVQSHRDMSNATTNYTYTGLGFIATLRNTTLGQSIDYAYDDAGHLRTIDDQGVNRLTTYGYDAAGRRASERTVLNGLTHQKTRISYDALGRISQLTDLRYKLTYQYDAQGNRTLTAVEYLDQSFAKVTQNLWYQYDAENRVTFSQGTALPVGDGTYLLTLSEQQGVRLTYNAAGQRTSATRFGTDRLLRAAGPDGTFTTRQSTGEFTERYSYDGAGRLTDISRSVYEQASTPEGYPQGNPVYLGEFNVIHRVYDGASRVIREDQQQVDPSTTISTYDDDGRLSDQTTRALNNISGAFRQQVTYQYDAANVLAQYRVQANEVDGSLKYNAYYINTYEARDTHLLLTQTVSTQGPGVDLTSGGIRREYNANREMVAEIDTVKADQSRYFANDASGNALTVVRGAITPGNLQYAFSQALTSSSAPYKAHHMFFANGEAVGSAGQLAKPVPSTNYSANFDVNYTPAVDLAPSAAPPVVVTREGETLRQIASRVWGDGTLWYLIADENGLTAPDEAMVAGLALRIPPSVVSVANDAATFKPFDINSAISELNPAQRGYASGQPATCGAMGRAILTIIAVVVTIVVAYYMGWETASAVGKVLIGAVAAMAGSVASQGAAVLTGYQDRIDWKQVALAGVGGAVGAGINIPVGNAGAFVSGAVNGAVGNVFIQGASVALGLQKSFSWREVAISALAGGAANVVGNAARARSADPRTVASKLKIGLGQGVTSGAVRAAFGEKVDFARVVVDAFGNALGNSIVANLSASDSARPMAQQADGSHGQITDSFLDGYLARHPEVGEGLLRLPELDETFARVDRTLAETDELLVRVRGEEVDDVRLGVSRGFFGDDIDLAGIEPFDVPFPRVLLAQNGGGSIAIPRGGAVDWRGVVRTPGGALRLGTVGALWTAADMLNQMSDRAALARVNEIIGRYDLDSTQAADVLAARAYVWAENFVPAYSDAEFSGPTNRAAAEAVMRLELVNPGLLGAATHGDRDAFRMVVGAANSAVADIKFPLTAGGLREQALEGDSWLVESRARPAGAPTTLQTTHARSRAAYGVPMPPGRWQLHHVIAANVWGANLNLSQLAYQAGWRVDSASNLIVLPADATTQVRSGGLLPIHSGPHHRYDLNTQAQITAAVTALGRVPTPLEARGLMETVSLANKAAITLRAYHPWMK